MYSLTARVCSLMSGYTALLKGLFVAKSPEMVEALLKGKADVEATMVRHLEGNQCASQLYSLVTRVFIEGWIHCSDGRGETICNPVGSGGLAEGESQRGSKKEICEAFVGSSARASCLLIARVWVLIGRTEILL